LWQTGRRRFEGQVFWVYVLMYSVLRGVVEIWRGDVARGVFADGHLSTSQLISIPLALLAAVDAGAPGAPPGCGATGTARRAAPVSAPADRSAAGRRIELTLTETVRGRRLDQVLAELLPDQSRATLQRLIRQGQKCHGRRQAGGGRSSARVRGGERIEVAAAPPEPSGLRPRISPNSRCC